ncbi:MAG: anthranilate synthase component I family protein [Nitrosopumilus sp.]|nr:anthranilate synthase component I family protein [Nitrosopumilus sp.]
MENETIFTTINTKLNPFEIFQRISKYYNDLFIFESLEGPKELIKSSIIGFGPKYKIKCLNKKLLIFDKDKKIEEIPTNDPLNKINEYFTLVKNQDYRYVGGLVGYTNYESIKYWEKIKVKHNKYFPLMEFGLYTDGIIFDHDKQKLEYFYYEKSRLQHIENIINKNQNTDNKIQDFKICNLSRNVEKKDFEKMVKKVKKYLNNGDVFQTVLSKKIEFSCSGNPLFLYQTLRKINPSPYMFYFRLNKRILIGSSPEMLLRITNKKVETYPIAGSRPVSKEKHLTEKYKDEMLNDEKEIAEHTMLVDLARNDLGKVCKFGTVKTDELMSVKQFSHIQHIVSHIIGELDSKYSVFDAFKAVFPAGTVSGAPKVRSMEIINELEKESRGPYAGAIGYFSFNKSCDFAITIRSIFISGNKGYNQSGAGIVIDSVPETEFKETEDKSNAILLSLNIFENQIKQESKEINMET